jgi:hypothetical protein
MEFYLILKKEEGNNFILEDEKKSLFYWPKDKLPKHIKEGEKIKISINQPSAKELLNEIIRKDISKN